MLEILELIEAKVKLLFNYRSALIAEYNELLKKPYHYSKTTKEIVKIKAKIDEIEKEVISLLDQLRELQRDLISVLPPQDKNKTINELFQSMMSEGNNSRLVYTKETAMIFVHGPERVEGMKKLYDQNNLFFNPK